MTSQHFFGGGKDKTTNKVEKKTLQKNEIRSGKKKKNTINTDKKNNHIKSLSF